MLLLLVTFLQSFTYPLLGLVIVMMQYVFYEANEDPDGDWIEERNKVLAIYITLLVCIVIVYTSTAGGYSCVGEKLTYQLRIDLFTSTLYKQTSWFEEEGRTPRALAGLFSENMEAIQGVTSEATFRYLEAIFTFAIGTQAAAMICIE